MIVRNLRFYQRSNSFSRVPGMVVRDKHLKREAEWPRF